MKQKSSSFLLALLLSMATNVAMAYDVEIDGIYYNLSGDEAEVTSGDTEYTGSVVIPETITYNANTYSVTSIGNAAFIGCSGLSSITIPNSVTSIGNWAFQYCSGLTSATISEGVTSIGNSAFSECNFLHSIIIPNSVTTIGDEAFSRCLSMGSLTLGSGLTSIGRSAFSECGLISVTIPSSMTSIGSGVFCGCSGLTSVTIPESVTSIGSDAFNECFSLTSITIPSSVTSIGSCAFLDCYFASSSFVNNSLLTSDNNWGAVICDEETTDGLLIKDYTVVKCRRWATSVTIPENVTSIGNYAFNECWSLRSVTISEGVTSIGDHAFSYCHSLTSVTISGSVTSIGDHAFHNCDGLTTVTIPEGVTSIGYHAFGGCFGLTSITIPNSVTSIGERAFYNCTSLTSITIPNSVTSIGYETFYGCSSLTSVSIPERVTSIGTRVFTNCPALTMVKVNQETPLSIYGDTFPNQSNAALYVPYGCKAIYEAADYWKDFKEIVETNTVNVGSTGFATYSSPNALDFSSISDIKAYIASDFNSDTYTLTLTRVTEAPAGEGLYIVGEAGTYVIPETTTDAVYSNLLKGVTYPITISPTVGDYTNFILANGSHGVGFYTISTAGEMAVGKAYLQLPTASVSEVKAISVIFDDDDATGISLTPTLYKGEGAIYNLPGQQVNTPKNGLYIINGKKVFIK